MSAIKKGRNKEARDEFNYLLIAIAVFLIIFIIIVYFISLGGINLIQQDERAKRIQWLDKRLKDLHVQAKSKEELKEKLDKKVRQFFLYTRIVLVVIYVAVNAVAFIWLTDAKMGYNDRLSALLNYNEGMLIFILIALFIRFETPAEFRDVFKIIHLYIKGKVYKNHEELEMEIKAIYMEIDTLRKEKEILETEPTT